MGNLKTFLLMAVLVLIFMWVGDLIGGQSGMKVAFWLAFAMNFFSYFFSDKLVLKHYHAHEVKSGTLFNMVQKLCAKADLPMPKVYTIDERVPNAFATGRNPSHAAVAVTKGLLDAMDEVEIEGVLAHELSHIKHYDILTSSVATVFAGAIAMLANSLRYRRSGTQYRQNGGIALLLASVLMPIAASIVRLAVSRTREFEADAGSARITGHPEYLVSALQKLEAYAKTERMAMANNETAHMFIINPLSAQKADFSSLFSTHPSTSDRINRLTKMMKG
ncbi:MAG: zinc metalloprotease HtpX [Alphaproteobacteria bacterium]|nr:zinc metalloprotease HtpX [Alphaproteobacteria bacterium]